MRYLKLTVAYDGANYVGWQVQPNGISIQQRLEEAWTATTQESIRIVASGRTDAGVHALGQVCSVVTQCPHACDTLRRALNAHTPEDISVVDVQLAPDDFHAIRDAKRKTYRYQIQFGQTQNPLTIRDHWFFRRQLDADALQAAAKKLTGEHDFASFQAAGAERKSTVRNLSRLNCKFFSDDYFNYLHIELTSNGFLYNMVRNIVGTLVRVGQGSEAPNWVQDVLDGKDRSLAGQTAPAHALVLVSVEYEGVQFTSDSR
jgi:tRNA pseudouridine38-40 synthase